ncbi:hypothetical protein CsSME_00045174 [Camellia sinensis var. sinensis]
MGSSRIVWSITSYDLVIGMLLLTDQIDAALKYIDLTLKSGYILSVNMFTECVRTMLTRGGWIHWCQLLRGARYIYLLLKMDQNKALCPPGNLCNYITDVAMEEDSSELAYYALEFMAKWIGLVVSALGTASRTYNAKLLDGLWAILKRALRQKKVPNPESYLAKTYAHASLGNLRKAFSTLHGFETTYRNFAKEAEEDPLSPFTSLYPLVMACSKDGFVTLDSIRLLFLKHHITLVYYQLENLSQADPPYKSVAALNCIILGSIDGAFGLIPNTYSYNALKCAFVKLNMTSEASSVFDHLISKGVKPNSTTYSLFVNTHLVKRDQKAALSVINEMVNSGFEPSREMLKKVRSDDQVESLARKYKIRMGIENRRDLLFNLQYSTAYA